MKKLLFEIRYRFFWFGQIHQGNVSEAWSNKLQKLIDVGTEFNLVNIYTAYFGDELLWITNVPYASFERLNPKNMFHTGYGYLPNKRVVYQLALLLKRAKIKEKQDKLKDFEASLNN